MRRFADRGWRRLVASPRPLRIVAGPTVRRVVQEQVIVIAAGGGGIPVLEENGRLEGVDAVIDKDLACAVLAASLDAKLLLILTDVEQACLNFQTPRQQALDEVTAEEAERYLAEGHFSAGSMGPKTEAAIQFVRSGGREAIITSPEALERSVAGQGGTHVLAAR